MKKFKTILFYGTLGGFMTILVHLLGSIIFYIAGLFFPIVFTIVVWLALRDAFRKFDQTNFWVLYSIASCVFLLSYLINILYIVLAHKIVTDSIGTAIASSYVVAFGLVLSLIITAIFRLLNPTKKY